MYPFADFAKIYKMEGTKTECFNCSTNKQVSFMAKAIMLLLRNLIKRRVQLFIDKPICKNCRNVWIS